MAGTGILLWLLNLLFQRLVIERLGVMISMLAEKKKEPDPGSGDELDLLHDSLGSLRSYVRSARQGATLQPNFISDYVVPQPLATGAMSWLYSGYHAESGDKVALKVGFDEALQNPLYRACFESELHLFETMSHPCLPRVRERLADVLILEEVQGKSLMSLLKKGRLDDRLLLPVFSELCDLVATFHAAGIVHHDLRLHILMFNEQQVSVSCLNFLVNQFLKNKDNTISSN